MNKQEKFRYIKIFGLLGLCISGLIYAVALLNTDDQPTIMIGKYALKSNDLILGDTRAYRSWYENGAWQGDVIEYEILSSGGTRQTDVPVGANPATAGDAGLCGRSPGCWSARATFIAAGADDPTDDSYWKSRNIITTTNGNQIDFLWNNLSGAQKLALDSTTINNPDGDPTTDDAVNPDQDQSNHYFSPILNYIRGDRSKERNLDGGFLRRRYSVLGDITRSPLYIGPPRELLGNLEGYSEFRTSMASVDGVVATPANDGMMHFLDADSGAENYAYIPSMVVGKLDKLAARNTAYNHTYYMDGEMTVLSAQDDPTTCNDTDITGCQWKRILAGGGGAGFKGLFALDVTNPGYSSDKVLFEKTGTDFGNIYGAPRIATLGTKASPAWYVITGNGYGSFSNEAKLLFIPLDGSYTPVAVPVGTNTRGLSAPTLLSLPNSDLQPELAFAGDMNGDLWMFLLDKANPANSSFVKIFSGDQDRPITTAPTISEHPELPGSYMVLFGTGSLLSEHDALDDISSQAVYGLLIKKAWIDAWLADPGNAEPPTITDTDLQTQTINTTASTLLGQTVRVMDSNREVPLTCPTTPDPDNPCTPVLGWKTPLPDCGQRLIGDPFLRAKRLQFVTTNPTGPATSGDPNCTNRDSLPGDSWITSLDFLTGGDGGEIVYNLNGDLILSEEDTLSGQLPVSLSLGSGNIAQPAFVRLRNGIDKMYINGIILPVPPLPITGPILSGHIDVQTDSPLAGQGGETAPNNVSKHSEGYNVTSSDGLGRGVDGHVHKYDTIHGVDYVDLFELEPRRGLANLGASVPSIAPDISGDCPTGENQERIPVKTVNADGDTILRCIEAIEGELNRAYDTYTPVEPDVTGGVLSCPDDSVAVLDDDAVTVIGCTEAYASETYMLSGLPIDPDQKFIVTLANADLSFSGTLQIGCRTWPVLEYQDLVTTELERNTLVHGEDLPDFFNDNNLVLTLADILKDTGCIENIAAGTSDHPTLRVGFGQRSILDEGVVGTRAQCVLGLHDYRDPVDYQDSNVLCYAEEALTGIPANCPDLTRPVAGYIKDPADGLHVTEIRSEEGSGFRWRNGALVVQLLAVSGADGEEKVGFTLQPPDGSGSLKNLPVQSKQRFGGTHAYAYELVKDGSVTTALTRDPADGTDYKGPAQSGLLYEASMFWHYSELADNLRTGEPASTPCYGDPNWKGRISQEHGGLTLGEYQGLTNSLVTACENSTADEECPLDAFARLLREIEQAPDEDTLNQKLLEMADLLDANPLLADYAKYREYAPGHIPEQHLLDIDKNLDDPGDGGNSSSEDGTPADVTAIEVIDLESKGPNAVLGQRNWIDLRQ